MQNIKKKKKKGKNSFDDCLHIKIFKEIPRNSPFNWR
jgi:hypothetical protein